MSPSEIDVRHEQILRGDWGRTVPPKIWGGGDGPCIHYPNISRNSVTGCVAKYELTKKEEEGGIFLNREFLSKRLYWISDSRERLTKYDRWLKRRSSEIFGVKMEIFSEKLVREIFFRPQKLGAKSPPMMSADRHLHSSHVRLTLTDCPTFILQRFESRLMWNWWLKIDFHSLVGDGIKGGSRTDRHLIGYPTAIRSIDVKKTLTPRI